MSIIFGQDNRLVARVLAVIGALCTEFALLLALANAVIPSYSPYWYDRYPIVYFALALSVLIAFAIPTICLWKDIRPSNFAIVLYVIFAVIVALPYLPVAAVLVRSILRPSI